MKYFALIFSLLICSILTIISCKKENNNPLPSISGKGVFILNQGNFQANNGSMSCYDIEKKQLINDIFFLANNRLLGDIPQSMIIKDSLGYVVVNNSGKIEIININTFISTGTITGFPSPRYMLFISGYKAYVSNLFGNTIDIVDVHSKTITGTIPSEAWIEEMITTGDMVFALESGGHRVLVINSLTDSVIYHIQVNEQPNSVVIDKNNKIWVLSGGSYMEEECPGVNRINAESLEVEQYFPFDTINYHYPQQLRINGTRDTLYFIDGGIYQMPVTAANVPAQALIPANNHLFFGLGIDPVRSTIYASDALDYQQKGYVYRFKADGTAIDSFRVDINPGFFCFK
jgi:hypothetical protein